MVGYTNTNAFVSQTLTNLNRKNLGVEFSFEYQINATLKLLFCLWKIFMTITLK
jgi:hypothetical protein